MSQPASAETAGRSIPTLAYEVPGLSQSAEILVDAWGVPHLYASSVYDAFFVQGFNAARDRLWQIDLWRKRGLGHLARDFGPAYLEQDKAARLFLYRGDLYREWLAYGSDAKRIAAAFAEGVNGYIALTRQNPDLLPREFKIVGYQPEEWSAEDIVRIRSHGLVRNVTSEVERARVACKGDLDRDRLRSRLEPEWTTSVPAGLDPCAIPSDVLKLYRLATGAVSFTPEKLQRPAPETGRRAARDDDSAIDRSSLGSNNWAIAPSKSATGRPILANDPHRAHSVPSLRYIAHLSAPGLDVIGAGEPALPGISIGHNGKIAFGLTIFSIDQEDLHVYEVNPMNRNEYRYQGRWEPMKVLTEEVAVKGQQPARVELKFTRHGPVIYEDTTNNRAYAVRAAWLEPGMAPYFGSVDYMRAQNWDEFLAAMNRWGSPSENQVYADAQGNIGWKPGGLTPQRPNWDGLLPVPGDGTYEWAGFHTMDELPAEFNPERGWVATANQMNLPEGYPIQQVKVGFEWTDPFRFNRIQEVLKRPERISIEDSMALQADVTSLPARRLTALLEGLPTPDPKLQAALDLLTRWDHRLSVDSAPAALFEIWFMKHLRSATIARAMPEELRPLIDRGGANAGDASAILALLENPDNRLGNDPVVARNQILLSSLAAALGETESRLGSDWARWKWGDLHQARFEHPVSPLVDEPTRNLLNVGPAPKGGSGFTVNNTGYGVDDFRVTSGASWRMVIDVGNWDGSWAVNAPGQSGDAMSPHYKDLFQFWRTESYFPLLYSRGAVEQVATQRIQLKPAPAPEVSATR